MNRQEEAAARIKQKFVHSLVGDCSYTMASLLDDFDALIAVTPQTAAATEFWLRLGSDLADYIEESRCALDVKRILRTIDRLEHGMLGCLDFFTETQRRRIAGISSRTRVLLVHTNSDLDLLEQVLRIYSSIDDDENGALPDLDAINHENNKISSIAPLQEFTPAIQVEILDELSSSQTQSESSPISVKFD